MIKEILEKSDNNIEGAKKLISEFKQKQSLNNPNNLNLHHSNRKRRYETAFLNNNSNINNTDSSMNPISISSFSNNANGLFNSNLNNKSNNGSSAHSVLLNPFSNSNLIPSAGGNACLPERRIIKFNNKIYPFNNANISFSSFVANSNNNANANNNNLINNLSDNNINNFNPADINLSNNSIRGTENVLNPMQNQTTSFNANFLENNSNVRDNAANSNNAANSANEILDDHSIENLLTEVGQYSSKDEIKAYLKNKITGLISIFNLLLSNFIFINIFFM